MKNKERLLYFWLSLSGVTPIKMQKLLEIYSIEELFDRIKKDKKINELVGEKTYELLEKNRNEDKLLAAYDELYKYDTKFLAFCDSEYPKRLKQAQVLPPAGLFYRGDISILKNLTRAIAIVGTRQITEYGKRVTEKFVSELVDYDIVIISGLATGIDSCAHSVCLKAKGKTIAVLGMGHSNFYPSDNNKLFDRICLEGLAVSEYHPTVQAALFTFPQRNRIISGLSDGVIIVEAAKKSGALITANRALEQGREIFAVPNGIFAPKSVGTMSLIKEGATMLTDTQDILKHFSLVTSKSDNSIPLLSLDIYEQAVYNLFEEFDCLSFDDIQQKSNFSTGELLNILVSLQMKGAIRQLSGNKYRKAI